jgi:integrase/recombinase XerD
VYRHTPPKKRAKRDPLAALAHVALTNYARHFLAHIEAIGLSPHTVKNRAQSLREFINWCSERSLNQPQDVTRPILERYRRHLFHVRQDNGAPLSFATQHARLVALKSFFKWATREGHILSNPASELELPKLHRRLPRHILTVDEVERILNQTAIHGELGLRDRAILETLYSTGMRRAEAANLSVYDVDINNGTVMIREGKGRKDRLIPIGERACAWIEKYREEVRPQYVREPDDGTLFLTEYGEPLHGNRLSDLTRKHLDAAGITKPGSCHLFRHTMATLMLENGADIRYIQSMLGHAMLSTTEIYTHVSIRKLKEIHAATHPAKMERVSRSDAITSEDTDSLSEREALLLSLVAEAEAEEGADGDEDADA